MKIEGVVWQRQAPAAFIPQQKLLPTRASAALAFHTESSDSKSQKEDSIDGRWSSAQVQNLRQDACFSCRALPQQERKASSKEIIQFRIYLGLGFEYERLIWQGRTLFFKEADGKAPCPQHPTSVSSLEAVTIFDAHFEDRKVLISFLSVHKKDLRKSSHKNVCREDTV